MYKEKLKQTPKAALNGVLFMCVFCFGLMGAARGIDEGTIGTIATLPSFSHAYGLKDPSLSKSAQANRLSNITSMVQLGSIAGCAFAFWVSDRFGRIRATQELCLVWILGVIIAISSNGHLGQLFAGRFIMGLGIGQTTVVAPTYLAEISPRAIRGLCTTMFAGSVYLGIMLGYFTVYGCSLHVSKTSATQWRVPMSLHIIFASIIFISTFFLPESPRWALKKGNEGKARAILCKIRQMSEHDPYLRDEFSAMVYGIEEEKRNVHHRGLVGTFIELFTGPANRYRLFLGIASQVLGQWSGAGSITIYAPQFFAMVGVASNTGLLTTAVFGVVKFIAALSCAFFLIDFIGRKRSLSIGICLQFVSILYMGLYIFIDPGAGSGKPQSASQKGAGVAAIIAIYVSGWGWAMGWNSIQYLINAEIFPLPLRSMGTSVVMMLHFANQYGNTKAVPSMFLGMGHGGTMIFFAAVTLIGLVFVFFCIPEVAGKSLEDIDRVFELPWYQVGRKGGTVQVAHHGDSDTEANRESVVEGKNSIRTAYREDVGKA